MPMSPSEILINVVTRVLSRAWNSGVWSGWICLKAHAINFYLRSRNRIARQPRVECPCCGWQGFAFRSLDAGHLVIPQIECPNCLSHHRHRLFQLLAERRDFPFLHPGSRILHGAPEWHVRKILEARAGLWVLSTDLEVDQVRNGIAPWLLCDLTCMPVSSDSFDAVFLFHVLEHIPDDRLALREIHRMLKPGGIAVIMVPVNPALSVTDEWGTPRKDLYDHVRDYSAVDFPDRLSAFEVEAVSIRDIAASAEQWRYMIYDHEIVYLCRKPLR